MSPLKIKVILGSTRANRFSDKAAQWIFDEASKRTDFAIGHNTFTATPVEPKAEVASLGRSTFEAQFRLGSSGEIEGINFLDQEFRRAKK